MLALRTPVAGDFIVDLWFFRWLILGAFPLHVFLIGFAIGAPDQRCYYEECEASAAWAFIATLD